MTRVRPSTGSMRAWTDTEGSEQADAISEKIKLVTITPLESSLGAQETS